MSRAEIDEGKVPAAALRSELLSRAGFSHAFFTRHGGVSRPPFDSLNFAWSTGDKEAAVRENLTRAARALGVNVGRLYFLSQIHGVDVVCVDGCEDRDRVVEQTGDVVIASRAGVACAVRVADCVPVLVADRASGAVAAIHSGWQGTVANVVAAGVRALRDLIGGAGDLVAAIGPHIEVCCFEVGEDVASRLAACASATVVDRSRGPKPHVNLRAIVRTQLEALGIMSAAIDDVAGCTMCDRSRFFSYRRDGKASGRLMAAIVAR